MWKGLILKGAGFPDSTVSCVCVCMCIYIYICILTFFVCVCGWVVSGRMLHETGAAIPVMDVIFSCPDSGSHHQPHLLPSRDSYFKAFGPKDPIIQGCWAILMLRA